MYIMVVQHNHKYGVSTYLFSVHGDVPITMNKAFADLHGIDFEPDEDEELVMVDFVKLEDIPEA